MNLTELLKSYALQQTLATIIPPSENTKSGLVFNFIAGFCLMIGVAGLLVALFLWLISQYSIIASITVVSIVLLILASLTWGMSYLVAQYKLRQFNLVVKHVKDSYLSFVNEANSEVGDIIKENSMGAVIIASSLGFLLMERFK